MLQTLSRNCQQSFNRSLSSPVHLAQTMFSDSDSALSDRTATVDPDQLAFQLEQRNSLVLIDCRPFMTYNVSHIKGAINVNCSDRFNRKRLRMGKATLADLATSKEGKERLKRRNWKKVIVYDDCSDDLELLSESNTLYLVLKALLEDKREPVVLLGGMRDFEPSHQTQCEDHLMSEQRSQNSLLPELPSPSEINEQKDIENHPVSQVLPFLYLGNMKDASDNDVLRRLDIKYVLNVTSKPPSYEVDSDVVYKQLRAADNGQQNLRQFFEEAFEFINRARDSGHKVLIHCQAGVSRSATIAVAYLMKHQNMAMTNAYKFVKNKRSIISPNLNFMGQLYEFEQGLLEDNKILSEKERNGLGSTGSSFDSEKSYLSSDSPPSEEINPFFSWDDHR